MVGGKARWGKTSFAICNRYSGPAARRWRCRLAGGCAEPRGLRGAGPLAPAPALHGGGCRPPRPGVLLSLPAPFFVLQGKEGIHFWKETGGGR